MSFSAYFITATGLWTKSVLVQEEEEYPLLESSTTLLYCRNLTSRQKEPYELKDVEEILQAGEHACESFWNAQVRLLKNPQEKYSILAVLAHFCKVVLCT